jgi:hypothetical protein
LIVLLDIKKEKRIKYRSRLDVMAAIIDAAASAKQLDQVYTTNHF